MRKMTDVENFIEFCASEFGREIMDREAEYIRNEFQFCKKILDVGCGIGSIEERLLEFDITGIDSSEEMLEEARKRSDKEFIHGDAENLPFEENSFDGILYLTTLEFIPDYKKALKEASRVLTENGELLAMVLNPESEYFRNHIRKKDSYFNRVRNRNLSEIKESASKYFAIKDEYFLGIRGKEIFPTPDRRYASLYAIKGHKNG